MVVNDDVFAVRVNDEVLDERIYGYYVLAVGGNNDNVITVVML